MGASPQYHLLAAVVSVYLEFLPYSIDVRIVNIGGCDVSFRGGLTNPSVRVSLSNIYIKITGRYRKVL